MTLCYRDRAFCSLSSVCSVTRCDRNFTPEQRTAARVWWGGDDAPIAFTDFPICDTFQKLKVEHRSLTLESTIESTIESQSAGVTAVNQEE